MALNFKKVTSDQLNDWVDSGVLSARLRAEAIEILTERGALKQYRNRKLGLLVKILYALKGKLPFDFVIGVFLVFPLIIFVLEWKIIDAGIIPLDNAAGLLARVLIAIFQTLCAIVVFTTILRLNRNGYPFNFIYKYIYFLLFVGVAKSWQWCFYLYA